MTLNTELMFSSDTDKWDTPQDLIDDLATVFDWGLDVCASGANVCSNYYTEAQNGLTLPWGQLNWCNPPYGRGDNGCAPWLQMGEYKGNHLGLTTVFLVPARTDTKWWHDYVPDASQVVFIRGRLKFGDAANSAPFPSAFVVFGEISDVQRAKLASYGWSIDSERQQLEIERELTHEFATKLALCQEELEKYKAAALLSDPDVMRELVDGHGLDIKGVPV